MVNKVQKVQVRFWDVLKETWYNIQCYLIIFPHIQAKKVQDVIIINKCRSHTVLTFDCRRHSALICVCVFKYSAHFHLLKKLRNKYVNSLNPAKNEAKHGPRLLQKNSFNENKCVILRVKSCIFMRRNNFILKMIKT